MTTEESNSYVKKIGGDVQIVKEAEKKNDFQQLTVSTIVKTMFEVIMVKKKQSMDEETRKQFPSITKEIILLAEQIQ